MAIVDLPDAPGPASVGWRVLDFGQVRVPPLGGPAQRINRSGTRWAVDVELPPMAAADTRRWQAALMAGVRGGVRWRVRQVGLTVAPLGNVRVNGAGQTGQMLIVDGGTAGAPWAHAQFVNLISGGNRYLHQLSGAGSFSGGGAAVLVLNEPLRVSPADNDMIDFAPRIEGLLTEPPTVAVGRDRLGRISFSIEEIG